MSRSKSSMKNIFTGLSNRIIQLLLSFINRKVFIMYLGVEFLGINGLFSDILSMLSMADLGFGVAMSYTFYKPLSENDQDKVAALVQFYSKIYYLIAIVISIIGVSLIPFLKFIINLEKPIDNLYLYYLIFLANTVISYLFVYKTTIITADQKGYIINNITSIISIIRTLVQIIVLVVFKNYILYIIINVVMTLLNNIIVSITANHLYPYIKNKRNLSSVDKKSIFKNLFSVMTIKISSVLINSTDNIIISTILGTVYVGLYSNYNTIITQLVGLIGIIFNSLTASIGNLIYDDNVEARYKIYREMQMISNIISGISIICIYYLINDFIVLWLGKEYIFSDYVVVSIILNLLLQIVLQPLWSFREATALYLKTKYSMVMAAILNIILSIVLAKYMGISGVILGSFLSRILTYFWYEPYLLFKIYFKKPVREYYCDFFRNIIVILAILILLYPMNAIITIESWANLILRGISYAIISIIVYLLIYRKQPEFKNLLLRIKSLVK